MAVTSRENAPFRCLPGAARRGDPKSEKLFEKFKSTGITCSRLGFVALYSLRTAQSYLPKLWPFARNDNPAKKN